MKIDRRQLIIGATALVTITSPAIVQATSIMRIRPLPQRFLLSIGFQSGGGTGHICNEIESIVPLTESGKAKLMSLAKALLPHYASPSDIFSYGWQLLDDCESRQYKNTLIYGA